MGFSVLSDNDIRMVENQIKEIVKTEQINENNSSIGSSASNLSSSANKKNLSTVERFLMACADLEMDSQPQNNRRLSLNEEFWHYKTTATSFLKDNKAHSSLSLLYWKSNCSKLPTLAELARRYLSAPGTSISSESAFSMSSYIGRKERACLSAESLSMLMFLKDKISSKNK